MSASRSESIPCSLKTLHSHSIFIPGPASDSKSDSEWELVEHPDAGREELVPLKRQRMVMRDKEIIVAVGKDVRMATVSGDRFEMRNEKVGSYSTLVSPDLSFPILSLVLSPNKRFLAVTGRSQLVILILPKPGSATRGDTPCRSIIIDQHELSAGSSTPITKVLWHSLGQGGESLWVMTSDALLREYDITSPYDPVQTFSFISPSSISTSKFSAIDPLSRYATSFAFGGPARAGWGECAIHGLMANGDLYTLCPVLPLKAEVPIRWIQRLKAFVQSAGTEEDVYWVDALARQVKLDPQGAGTSGAQTPNIRMSVLGRSTRTSAAQSKESEEVDGDQLVSLHPPHLTAAGGPASGTHLELERQGPAIFDPCPEEADEEDMASDLLLVNIETSGDASPVVPALSICWSSGRVDIALQSERPSAGWIRSASSRDKAKRQPTTIPIVESIQLDIPDKYTGDNAPALMADLLHPGTLYIHHLAGVDAVSLEPLARALQSPKGDLPDCDTARLVQADPAANGIEGLTTCYSMNLGYAVLALGATNRLAAVELDVRSGDDPQELQSQKLPGSAGDNEPDQASLLLSHPLDYDALLSSLRTPASLNAARAALEKLPGSKKPLSTIGAEHLRAIGNLIASLQGRIELVRAASASIERHLDRHAKEFQRQLQLLQQTSRDLDQVKKHEALSRAERLLSQQGKLGERMDAVLSGVTERYRPPVGEVEKRWFEELEGIRVKIKGGRGFGLSRGGGLQAQVDELEEQLDVLKPKADAVKKEIGDSHVTPKKNASNAKDFKPLESALYQRIDEIGRLMRKMDSLKVQVDNAIEASATSLGSPGSQR